MYHVFILGSCVKLLSGWCRISIWKWGSNVVCKGVVCSAQFGNLKADKIGIYEIVSPQLDSHRQRIKYFKVSSEYDFNHEVFALFCFR